MTTPGQDIAIVQGDSFVITVTVTEGGVAKNLTDATIKWACARRGSATVVLQKQTGAGVAITNAAGGIFTVTLTPADTAALLGDYVHEAQVTDALLNVATVLTGALSVTEDLIS